MKLTKITMRLNLITFRDEKTVIKCPSDLRCEDDDDKLGSDSFDERVFLGDDRSSILKLAPLPPLCDDGILLVHAELSKCNRQVQVYNLAVLALFLCD